MHDDIQPVYIAICVWNKLKAILMTHDCGGWLELAVTRETFVAKLSKKNAGSVAIRARRP